MASPLAHNLGGSVACGFPSLPVERVAKAERSWYAVYTLPQNERSVARYLDINAIESFLPTCESIRRWKNRQRVKIVEAHVPDISVYKNLLSGASIGFTLPWDP